MPKRKPNFPPKPKPKRAPKPVEPMAILRAGGPVPEPSPPEGAAWVGRTVLVPSINMARVRQADGSYGFAPVTLWWSGLVLTTRWAWGRLDLLVEPVAGYGRAWVSAQTILDQDPAAKDKEPAA